MPVMPVNLPPGLFGSLGRGLLGISDQIQQEQDQKKKEALAQQQMMLQYGLQAGGRPDVTTTVTPPPPDITPAQGAPKAFGDQSSITAGRGLGMEPSATMQPSALAIGRTAGGTQPPPIFRGAMSGLTGAAPSAAQGTSATPDVAPQPQAASMLPNTLKTPDLKMPPVVTTATAPDMGYDEYQIGKQTYHKINPQAAAQQESNRQLESRLTETEASQAGDLKNRIAEIDATAAAKQREEQAIIQGIASAQGILKTGTPEQKVQAEAYIAKNAPDLYAQMHKEYPRQLFQDKDGNWMAWDSRTNTVEPAPVVGHTGLGGGGATPQRETMLSAMEYAHKELTPLQDKIGWTSSQGRALNKASAKGGIGGAIDETLGGAMTKLSGDDAQRAQNAADAFATEVAHYISGARISDQQLNTYRSIFVPNWYDDPATVKAKEARRTFMIQAAKQAMYGGKPGQRGEPDEANADAVLGLVQQKFPDGSSAARQNVGSSLESWYKNGGG